MRWRWLIAATLVLFAGCESDYHVRQASTVPLPLMPPPAPGKGAGELYMGAPALLVTHDPEALDPGRALYTERWPISIIPSFRFTDFYTLRPRVRVSTWRGAHATDDDLLPALQRPLYLVGVSNELRGRVHPRVTLGVGLDILVAGLPTRREVTICDLDPPNDCSAPYPEVQHAMAGILGLRFTASGWAHPRIRLFLGAGLQNHPSNVEYDEDTGEGAPRAVHMGPAVAMLLLGADFVVHEHVTLVPQLHWPVAGAPIRYRPAFGLGVRVGFAPDTGSDSVRRADAELAAAFNE